MFKNSRGLFSAAISSSFSSATTLGNVGDAQLISETSSVFSVQHDLENDTLNRDIKETTTSRPEESSIRVAVCGGVG